VRAIAPQVIIAPRTKEAGRVALYLDSVKCADEIASLGVATAGRGRVLRRSAGPSRTIEKLRLVER
jgi:hypothetical protein